ncbi:MAG: hypothetical protein GY820_08300 [Gammaproteobacteria bacterium]|nr:hypothetical protein [Gammaproteobacteria bacterium]
MQRLPQFASASNQNNHFEVLMTPDLQVHFVLKSDKEYTNEQGALLRYRGP